MVVDAVATLISRTHDGRRDMVSSSEWLEPDETEVDSWTAAVPTLGGRGAKYGGRLWLSSRRLVWVPLRVRAVSVAHGVVLPIEAGGTWWEKPLADVARVEADAKHRALMHIVDRDGQRTSFLVAAGSFGPVWSKKNQRARDDAIARVTGAIV
jgi:hypothetical protein